MGRESIHLLLASFRAAVSRSDQEDATRIFDEVREQGDVALTIRGWIQMALLYQQTALEAEAERSLREALTMIEDRRSSLRERDLGEYVSPDERAELDEIRGDDLEVHLQLARAWQRIGRLTEARDAYESLLRELNPEGSSLPIEQHITAIAEYRLADLRVEEAPQEAYERWRRVVEMRDEEVSPYAALRMALQIGSTQLVSQRVERLFHYAMGTSDPRLYAEAALGLARHLKERHEFTEARRYLRAVSEVEGCTELAGEGIEELEEMDRYEAMVKTRNQLRRPQQLQAKAQRGVSAPLGSTRRVILVGAGKGGSYLLESLDARRYTVCGFVDDYATELAGYPEHPILGRIDDLVSVIRDLRPDEILLAIPTLSGERRNQVVQSCRQMATPLLNLPGVHELGIGWTRTSLMNQLRPVKVAETLGEEPRSLDTVATGWLQYRVALVIGAGAIGAELCRRLADAEVARLVVVDKRESALKKVEAELRDFREFWAVDLRLGDAGEPGFLAGVFEACTPYIVINATGDATALAFDESRLATDQRGWKSLFDNEIGAAWEAARAAGELGAPHMVHVSSRRAGGADDPLGAMKLLCEELVIWHAMQHSETIHTVVRLGALLDSRNGPFATMERQIRAGAVVTVPSSNLPTTFVPTARWAELVLHAGRLAEVGELFEPAAGVQVSPREVAQEAIELAGLYAEDVVIEETARERWDEPCSHVAWKHKGDPRLEMRALERPAPSDERLNEVVERCAAVLDHHVSAGSGATAALVLAILRRLCDTAELVP